MEITYQRITKRYGSFLALEIDHLALSKGIHWIKGVNGSGKTTLLKITAGLLPFEGDILLAENISIKKNPVEYRRRVNYAEAEPLYPSFLSGNDLITLFQKTKGGSSKQTDELIELLNVSSFINQPAGTYSSGMQKKLSLILAFIGNPKIILLDEPLVTIDDASVKVIYSLIEKYHTEKGITFLLTSHQHFDSARIHLDEELLVQDHTLKLVSK